ncbi:Transcription and mRNA export factor eny2 [Bulinus truncatus]|nr:Transcription and mRNA export factor eny2 [Bulinus truncatus]
MADLQERKLKDAQMRATINQKLVETGERERLKELLRARLIECGWRDQLKAYCKEIVQQKGLEHITVDDLVSEITPRGRSLVPDEVKKELLQRIRTFLAQQANGLKLMNIYVSSMYTVKCNITKIHSYFNNMVKIM